MKKSFLFWRKTLAWFKTFPEDFCVKEDLILQEFLPHSEGRNFFFYLKKVNMSQEAALHQIAKFFSIKKNSIRIAGIKDRFAITSQYLSIPFKDLSEFLSGQTAERSPDLSEQLRSAALKFSKTNELLDLHYIGRFRRPLYTGALQGNQFRILLRMLSEKDIHMIQNGLPDYIANGKALNLFDEQRFGYAGNSHIIGKFILSGDLEAAVREILLSLPDRPGDEQNTDMMTFHTYVKNNPEILQTGNTDRAIGLAPGFLRNEKCILQSLKKQPGNFRKALLAIQRRLLKLYINAYQADIFNRSIFKLQQQHQNDLLYLPSLPLIFSDLSIDSIFESWIQDITATQKSSQAKGLIRTGETDRNREEYRELAEKVYDIICMLLADDGLGFDDLNTYSIPEIRPKGEMRPLFMIVRDLSISEIPSSYFENTDSDYAGSRISPENTENVAIDSENFSDVFRKPELLLQFSLGPGHYATTFLKQLVDLQDGKSHLLALKV